MSESSGLRIIDANVNRAREAIRVMEEYARLVLDDALLTRAFKETRHELAKIVSRVRISRANVSSESPSLMPDDAGPSTVGGLRTARSRPLQKRGVEDAETLLIRSRDIVGDVGRDVGAAGEYERADAEQVVLASGKRLSESLRTIEEYGKMIDVEFAASIEELRYRGYDLERRLDVTLGARKRLETIKLYVIITESLCRGDWLTTAEAALRGGADALQLREKHLSDREHLVRAGRLVELCHDYDALSFINDRPDIAVAAGADGVHLGRRDLPVSAARRIVRPHMLVGVSTHTIEQVEAAARQAPDYLAVGPMFPTSTKPQDHIAGTETLAAARSLTGLPLVAIGGINPTNAAKVIEAAPCIVCVCRAVLDTDDPARAAGRLRETIESMKKG